MVPLARLVLVVQLGQPGPQVTLARPERLVGQLAQLVLQELQGRRVLALLAAQEVVARQARQVPLEREVPPARLLDLREPRALRVLAVLPERLVGQLAQLVLRELQGRRVLALLAAQEVVARLARQVPLEREVPPALLLDLREPRGLRVLLALKDRQEVLALQARQDLQAQQV
jgi:hypothetical protein